MSHKCEECDEGMLYYNYTERVEYDDPGPSRGVTGTYLSACPNSPRACISFNSGGEGEHHSERYKKRNFKCDVCSKKFESLCFHINRNHVKK